MAKKRKGQLQKRAKRDVNLAFKPELREIDRAGSKAKDDLNDAQKRIGNTYDALQQNLAPLTSQYGDQYQGIVSGLQSQMAELGGNLGFSPDALGVAGAGAEGDAAKGMLGTIGGTGLGSLANDYMRNASYQTSVQRQGEIERATTRKRYLEEYRDLIADLDERKLDIQGDKASAIIQRLDELRDRRRGNRLQKRELKTAEKLFERDWKWDAQDRRSGKRNERAAKNLVRSQAERKGDQAKIKPIKKKIKRLKGERNELKDQFEPVDTSGGPPDSAANDALTQQMQKLTKKIKKKKRKVKKIRKTDNPNY